MFDKEVKVAGDFELSRIEVKILGDDEMYDFEWGIDEIKG